MAIIVSACLLGICCRYDGKIKTDENICSLAKTDTLIPVCPEQLGGRPTPRLPVEIKNGRVVEKDGADHTDEFIKGAYEVLKIAKINCVKNAVLKSNSPSCGFGKIYDGTFSGKLVDGNGVFAGMLSSMGIEVITEKEKIKW